MDLDEYRVKSRDSWDRFSGNWAENREFLWDASRAVGEKLIAGVEAQPGQTLLELAAGTGDTGFAAAAMLGEDGKLISTDFAPGMVAEARKVGEALGLSNVEYRELDAENMDLDDASIDGVICRWGYMLMADPAAALAETKRVLRDGGRVSFAVWATPEVNMWAALPALELFSRGHMEPPDEGAPGIFAMGDPARIRELVGGAGFGDPEIDEVVFDWPYKTPEELWAMTMELAAPIAGAVAELDDEEAASVREAVIGKVAGLMENGPIGGTCHCVTAS